MIGPISLEAKQMGARSAGNPHAACDVEGAGNVAWSRDLLARQTSTLPVRGSGCNSLGLLGRAQANLWLKHRKPSLMTSKPEPSLCSGKSLADNLLTGHAASGVEEA